MLENWEQGLQTCPSPLPFSIASCHVPHGSLWLEVPLSVSFVLWSGHKSCCASVSMSPILLRNAGGLWAGDPCGSCKAGWDSVCGICSCFWDSQMWVPTCLWVREAHDSGSWYHQPSTKAIYPRKTGHEGNRLGGVDGVFYISLLIGSRPPLISPNLNEKVVQSLC